MTQTLFYKDLEPSQTDYDFSENNDLKNLGKHKYRPKTSFVRYKLVKPEMKKKKLNANNIPVSFHNRFLKHKKRILYYKTIRQNYLKRMKTVHAENLYLRYLDKYMPSIEKYELFKRSLKGYYTNFVSMSNRTHEYTRTFITHCVTNTFVTIFRGKTRRQTRRQRRRKDTLGMKVIAKVSSGLIGYKGPKKSTVFARKGVIKEAGNILASKMTSLLDVVFTSNVSRWNRKSVRDLCPNLSYVLNIYITYNRSHGYSKQKNKRRV